MEQAKQLGQTVSSAAEDGTYAAGVHRVTELMPSFMNDILASAPEDQKVRNLHITIEASSRGGGTLARRADVRQDPYCVCGTSSLLLHNHILWLALGESPLSDTSLAVLCLVFLPPAKPGDVGEGKNGRRAASGVGFLASLTAPSRPGPFAPFAAAGHLTNLTQLGDQKTHINHLPTVGENSQTSRHLGEGANFPPGNARGLEGKVERAKYVCLSLPITKPTLTGW